MRSVLALLGFGFRGSAVFLEAISIFFGCSKIYSVGLGYLQLLILLALLVLVLEIDRSMRFDRVDVEDPKPSDLGAAHIGELVLESLEEKVDPALVVGKRASVLFLEGFDKISLGDRPFRFVLGLLGFGFFFFGFGHAERLGAGPDRSFARELSETLQEEPLVLACSLTYGWRHSDVTPRRREAVTQA